MHPNEIHLRLKFFGESANDAVISQLSRRFETDINILAGSIEKINGRPLGQLSVRMDADEKKMRDVLSYLKENGIEAEVVRDALTAE